LRRILGLLPASANGPATDPSVAAKPPALKAVAR